MSFVAAEPGQPWRGQHSRFLNPESPFAADRLTDAAVAVLRGAGADRLTLGAVATELHISSQAVHKLAGGRAAFLDQVVETFLARRWAWLVETRRPARLPSNDDELHGLRVHHDLATLAASEHRAGRGHLAGRMSDDRRRRRDWMAYLARDRRRDPTSSADLDLLEIVVSGLELALLRPDDPLSYHRAGVILEEQLALTGWSLPVG